MKLTMKNILKMMKRVYPGLCFLTSIWLSHTLCATESPNFEHGTGLRSLSKEELEEIQMTWPRIVGVRPNKIGVRRIQEQSGDATKEVLRAALPEEEFITVIGNEEPWIEAADVAALPVSVNNSLLPSFPPIGDQQSEGSCVGFGSTYYQATHEIGLLNGYNNKTSETNVLSPRWTYNLLNGGYDQGLVVSYAFKLLTQNGAPSIVNFPYINGEYRSWDLNSQDWISALNNRMAPAQYISGVGGSSQNLQTIKQLLTNGHVLTFATYIYSWVFKTVPADPANPNSPYVGQQACTYMNGMSGGHFVTIVGYDDNLWIDVNGNGQIDAGERGAFLVANSWGSFWGNAGFTWISYDAFLNNSAVINGPTAGRVAASQDNYVYCLVPKSANYKPSLIGQFTLSQNYRDQIYIQAGLSATSQTTPSQTFACYALQNQGGPFRFDGSSSTTAQAATFVVDMSDFPISANTQRYYLVAGDTVAGNPTTLTAFSLCDLKQNKQINYQALPLNCDSSWISPFIDYAVTNMNDTTPPVVSITSPVNNSTVQSSISVNVNATDNVAVAKVEMYVDAALQATDTAAPYVFTLDTTKWSNGNHQLMATAYDTSGNLATTTTTINVQNGFVPIFVNCADGQVTYKGNTFMPDYGFSGTSHTYNLNVQGVNPIYSTSRYGANFFYNFSVPNGQYLVKFKMIEPYFNQPGKRVFSASINGSTLFSDLDLFKIAGFCVPYDLEFPVTVNNGNINMNLVSSINNATISGIRVIQQ